MNAQIFTCLCMAVIIPTALSNWQGIPPSTAVDISAKGNEVWIANAAQDVFRFDFVKRDWVQLPGSIVVHVGASPDGWGWVVNTNNDVFRFNKDKGNTFEQIPGQKLVQISVASKDRALGVNKAGDIWLWENNAWKQLPGAATWAGIGVDDERWVVNAGQQIFRWNKCRNDWDIICGAAVNIDVQNANRVIITNKEGVISVWKNNAWSVIVVPGTATRASINENMGFLVTPAQNIWFAKFNADGVSLAAFAWP